MQTHTDRYRNTAMLAVEHVDAPEVVTSEHIDQQLHAVYDKVAVRPGLLAAVAGVRERRWWSHGSILSDGAAQAGRAALERAGISAEAVGLLIDTSVSRDHLEPSAASAVHHKLRLASSCINFDLSNACLGFVSGMTIAAGMIDAGRIQYALIVDCEDSRRLQEATLRRLCDQGVSAGDLYAEFASLTLGSGAAATLLGPADKHPDRPKLVRSETAAATQHHLLCVGSMDRMKTDTAALMTAGVEAAEAAFAQALRSGTEWDKMDHYIIHQVSLPHTRLLCEKTGIELDKTPLTFPTRGNLGPASIPTTLSLHQSNIAPGERVLLGGIGSGVNVSACELLW